MAQYAKDQPAGFSNSIERVALVGAGGQIGRIITKHLLKNGKHTITAVVRKNSTSPLADGISVAKVDYDNENELVKALSGQQFLIIALAATAPEDVEPKIVKAAAKAGVAWILPYSYTDVLQNKSFDANSLVGPKIASTAKLIEDLGVSSYVISATSLWYEYALVMGTQFYGFDIANKQVEFIDDGSTKINTITWEQSGRAITSLLSLKELPEDENDKSPTISHWRNDILFVSSFLVSQRDIFASLNRVMGIQESDWEIKSEPSKERHARGFNELRAGNHMGFPTALYTRAFFPSGEGNYEDKHGLANDVLGLPKEDLDEATKTAVKMVRDKWQPSQHQILAKEY